MASRVAAMALAGAPPISPTLARPRLPPPSAARGGSSFASTAAAFAVGSPAPPTTARTIRPAQSRRGVLERLKGPVAALAIITQVSLSLPANAALCSPDTEVPRAGELALRRAIPANPNMKAIQESLEDISYLLRIPQRKPYGVVISAVLANNQD